MTFLRYCDLVIMQRAVPRESNGHSHTYGIVSHTLQQLAGRRKNGHLVCPMGPIIIVVGDRAFGGPSNLCGPVDGTRRDLGNLSVARF